MIPGDADAPPEADGRIVRATEAACWLVFMIGVAIYGSFAVHQIGVRGLWFDEYATMYFTDPSRPLAYVAADTNPPTYYFLVRLLRTVGIGAQAAMLTVNIAAAAGACVSAFLVLARARLRNAALVALGVVLASASVLIYVLEGRCYALAEFGCLAISAVTVARLASPEKPHRLVWAIAFGALVATTHLYSAIFVGALGATLALEALARRRYRDLTFGSGLVLGAILVVGLWVLYAAPTYSASNGFVNWVANSTGFDQQHYVVTQLRWFNSTLSGYGPNLALILLALGFLIFVPESRLSAVLVIGVAGLFILAPGVVSIKKPMLTARYLAIGGPSLVFLAMITAFQALGSTRRPLAARAGWGLAMAFAMVEVVAGSRNAAETHLRGYPFAPQAVQALLPPCNGPVRIMVPNFPAIGALDPPAIYKQAYATALERPGIRLESSLGPPKDVRDYCDRVVAWGENIFWFPLAKTTNDALLSDLGLTNVAHTKLLVVRRPAGFIIERAAANP